MSLSFYAKIDSINETTYDTYTLSVIKEDKERITLRIDKEAKIIQNMVYFFETEEIEFKEKMQLLATKFTYIDDCDITIEERGTLMTKFYEFAPITVEEIKNSIESYLIKIENKIIKDIVMAIYKKHEKMFYLYPAATKFHHAYISGLSYHTKTMMNMIDGFIKVYPFLNQDLLIAGIMLHDVCKVVELSHYAGPEYTKEGKLLGHITMGVMEIERTANELGYFKTEEALILEHMVLSHHYFPHFGSPKKPNVPEAIVLHFIDNIDSKLTVIGEQLAQVQPGEFTQPIGVADRERYYKVNFEE